MSNETIKIYCYSQQCVQAGSVVPGNKLADYRAGEENQSDDIFLAYEGTRDEIEAQAKADMARAGWDFTHKTAKAVLNYIA